MANDSFCKIINLTTNKWCREISDFDITKFYRTILPTYKKRISYIKKKTKDKINNDEIHYAELMECSSREIEMFNNTLAEFSNITK